MLLIPSFLSYIRYESWDVVREMIDVGLVLKELSRSP